MSMSPRHPVEPVDDRAEAPAAPASPSRRRFVRNAGLGAVALGAVAATGTALTGVASAQTATEPPDLSASDVQLLQFLQSIMLAAEEVLTQAAAAAGLESQVAEELRVFSRNSGTQAAAFGALLSEADAITAPNPRLLTEGTADVNGATTETAVLLVLVEVLETLAATLQAAVGQAQSFLVSGTISSVLPIVGQEATALGTAADAPIEQTVPAFGTTDGALTPAAYPAS